MLDRRQPRARARRRLARRCRGSSTPTTAARASSSATARPRSCSSRAPDDGPGLLAWDLGCDGSATGLLEIPAGGSRRPTTRRDRRRRRALPQDGRARRCSGARCGSSSTRRRSRSTAPASPSTTSPGSSPHQANVRIIEAAASRLGIPPERTLVNIDRYGNTSAASIPLVLAEAADDGRLQRRRPRAPVGLRRRDDVGQRRAALGPRVSASDSRGRRVRHRRVAGHRPRRRGRARPAPATGSRSATSSDHDGAKETQAAVEARRAARRSPCRPTSPTPTAVDRAFTEIEARVRAGRAAGQQRRHHPRRAARCG